MFNNLNSTLKKVLVIFLIITLTYANLVLVGSNIVKGLFSYAVEEGEETSNTNNEESGETLTNGEEETDTETIEEETALLNIGNKDIHKTTISEAGEVEYTEKLKIDLTSMTDTSKITIEDVSNEFYNNDETLNEEITLKYKTTTINKADLVSLLGEEGKLAITDTVTNKVLVELTNEVLSSQELDVKVEQKFTNEVTSEETDEETSEEVRTNVTVTEETVEIEYVLEVTNIKFELTNITVEQTETENEENATSENEQVESEAETEVEKAEFVIENTKTISNIKELDKLDYLQESVKYIINDDTENAETIESIIKFKDTITRADFTIDNTEWIVGQANKVKYTITLDTSSEKSELFVNPMFLLELPSSVESVNNENSEFKINNDNGAFTSKRVFVTTLAALNKKFVVITLEGEQTEETITNGNTTIDLTLELNIAESTEEGNETTKLYYQNDTVTVYESGKGFDTAEVTVSMIMESEPKYEIEENAIRNIQTKIKTSSKEIIRPLEEIEYKIYIENYETKEVQNLQLIDVLPQGITLEKVVELTINQETQEYSEENEIVYNYNELTRELIIGVDKLDAMPEKFIEDEETNEKIPVINPSVRIYKIIVKSNVLDEGIYSKEITNSAKVKVGKNIYTTNEVTNMVSDKFILVEPQQLDSKVEENEQIVFEVKATNKGLIYAPYMEYTANIPENIELIMAEYGFLGETLSECTVSGNEYKQTGIDIPAEKTYVIKLIGKVKEVDETKPISATGIFDGQEFSWNTEIVDVPTNSDGTTNPDGTINPEGTTSPDGTTNSDGTTSPDGTTNSDGVTEGFDLSLTQYLNKVTVTNSKGTTTYNYKDTNFAKIEIHSKQMNGSKVTLEYKIVIKNEGTIPGYARKIVDYMPKDLTFNSELNKEWFVGDDGNIYSVAFIDKLLNPGETAELTLTLEKKMTNDNVGTITNIIEIYEATNEEDIEDVNSIPADKLDGQNDMSKVEVLVVTSTGSIILYTVLAITVITIIGLGFYKVKKITLNKKGGC